MSSKCRTDETEDADIVERVDWLVSCVDNIGDSEWSALGGLDEPSRLARALDDAKADIWSRLEAYNARIPTPEECECRICAAADQLDDVMNQEDDDPPW